VAILLLLVRQNWYCPSAEGSFEGRREQAAYAIQQLSPAFAGGAQSLGNPTVSFVTLPPPTPGVASAPALVFTCFVFGENNGATSPGGHIFVYPLP
jgi:hypothetical protein